MVAADNRFGNGVGGRRAPAPHYKYLSVQGMRGTYDVIKYVIHILYPKSLQ
jgi:hypothetical protein